MIRAYVHQQSTEEHCDSYRTVYLGGISGNSRKWREHPWGVFITYRRRKWPIPSLSNVDPTPSPQSSSPFPSLIVSPSFSTCVFIFSPLFLSHSFLISPFLYFSYFLRFSAPFLMQPGVRVFSFASTYFVQDEPKVHDILVAFYKLAKNFFHQFYAIAIYIYLYTCHGVKIKWLANTKIRDLDRNFAGRFICGCLMEAYFFLIRKENWFAVCQRRRFEVQTLRTLNFLLLERHWCLHGFSAGWCFCLCFMHTNQWR